MLGKLWNGILWILKRIVELGCFALQMCLRAMKLVILLFCIVVRIFMSLVKIATP